MMQMTEDCEQLWAVPRRDLNVTVDIESNTGPWFETVEKISEKNDITGLHLDFILENLYEARMLHMHFYKGQLDISFQDISVQMSTGDDTCPICLDSTKNNISKILRTTCCRRVLHCDCADAAWMHKDDCPICRASTTEFEKPFKQTDAEVSKLLRDTISQKRVEIADVEKFWGKEENDNCGI